MKYSKLFFGWILLVFACGPSDSGQSIACSPSDSAISITNDPGWTKIKSNLYLGPKGELGFATNPKIFNLKAAKFEMQECSNVFITSIGINSENNTLQSEIDTATFEFLGSNFYKDKFNIYHHYAMCDGGYLNIFAKDTTSFKLLGCCYVYYNGKIFHERNGLLNADAKTFRTSVELGPAAKDKNGYFSFETRISEEEAINTMGEKVFNKLKDL